MTASRPGLPARRKRFGDGSPTARQAQRDLRLKTDVCGGGADGEARNTNEMTAMHDSTTTMTTTDSEPDPPCHFTHTFTFTYPATCNTLMSLARLAVHATYAGHPSS